MTEPVDNNVISVDFKNKKKNKSTEIIPKALNTSDSGEELQDQPLPGGKTDTTEEDDYKKFVTDPKNINKLEFIMNESMKCISLQYPSISTCRIGDALFLKESIVSLIMRSSLKQDHPFQRMADGLEKAYNRTGNNDVTK